MKQESRAIESNQEGVHPDVAAAVARYWHSEFQKPVAEHSLAAFREIDALLTNNSKPLILDSCCGVGESTAHLAARYPDALVVGVDKSAHRLGKHVAHRRPEQQGEYALVRADLNDFWRLAVTAQWPVQRHFLLYPNPWPKKKHLGRRWHGAPVFPALVQLGGELEMRSNWPIYLREFALALACLQIPAKVKELAQDIEPMTPFERKYQASGQPLWQLSATLQTPSLLSQSRRAALQEVASDGGNVLELPA
ncbi:MAG: SAM-dependent methyltransferase [Aliidiomarina sp.]|uniref:tRNA (guanine(46)-N(7))-methyltransferase TrmB n=1 Tax=Aliidiomarina sp. TaxID=1872439 RepID=UPI0025BBBC6C|nr:SAM-dependent methyltransferase [Aliidiomarina sp.]MCH8502383.1 SAM-dependent methyltransferase [Aliidiomarina sp.]